MSLFKKLIFAKLAQKAYEKVSSKKRGHRGKSPKRGHSNGVVNGISRLLKNGRTRKRR